MLIEAHLWYTSYFVIVMVLSMLIYAMLKGSRRSAKVDMLTMDQNET
jgi:hypothetical protein